MAGTADMNRAAVELNAEEARLLVLRAQQLGSPSAARADAADLLAALGAVQLDTISVLARSHELVPYSRLGAIGRPAVEAAFWGQQPARTFEYWGHATCLLPVEAWPYFAFRRRAELRSGRGRGQLPDAIIAAVRAQLESGPVTATELGGVRQSSAWSSRSSQKVAAEWLYWIGEAVCTDRRGWKRVYDLPGRVLPAATLGTEPSDEECFRYLVAKAISAMGVATRHDIADYYRLNLREVDAGLRDTAFTPVKVAGWEASAWADPAILANPLAVPHHATLLSPFDSLVWERKRMQRIFGFSILLEAYLPKHKRVHGYFSMPVLADGRLVGHVDPAKEGKTLVARQVSLREPEYLPALISALQQAAIWVGCDAVTVERSDPAAILNSLNHALKDSSLD